MNKPSKGPMPRPKGHRLDKVLEEIRNALIKPITALEYDADGAEHGDFVDAAKASLAIIDREMKKAPDHVLLAFADPEGDPWSNISCMRRDHALDAIRQGQALMLISDLRAFGATLSEMTLPDVPIFKAKSGNVAFRHETGIFGQFCRYCRTEVYEGYRAHLDNPTLKARA